MTGTLVNAALILLGGLLCRITRREMSVKNEHRARLFVAGLSLYAGFRLVWTGLSGGFFHGCGQLALAFLAMSLGRFLGSLMRIQAGMNRIARYAKECLAGSSAAAPQGSGFLMTAGLYCVTPLAFIGSIAEGMTGEWLPLAVKGMMDGLAALSFARTFGRGVVWVLVPVVSLQGTLALLAQFAAQSLANPEAIESLAAVSGCLIWAVALIVFGLPVKLGDYLPSLLAVPLLAQLWW